MPRNLLTLSAIIVSTNICFPALAFTRVGYHGYIYILDAHTFAQIYSQSQKSVYNTCPISASLNSEYFLTICYKLYRSYQSWHHLMLSPFIVSTQICFPALPFREVGYHGYVNWRWRKFQQSLRLFKWAHVELALPRDDVHGEPGLSSLPADNFTIKYDYCTTRRIL